MRSWEEEEPRWRMKMKPTMTSFSMIFRSIFQKSNIQKKPLLLIDFRNQEMIAKWIKIISAYKTEIRMRSPIWGDKYRRCRVRISRMASGTSTIRMISLNRTEWTMGSCFKASILNLVMEILVPREMLSSKVIENLTKLWRVRMMQPLDSISSTRYMLRKQDIAKRRLLSIKFWETVILIKRRNSILRFWAWTPRETVCSSTQLGMYNPLSTNPTISSKNN